MKSTQKHHRIRTAAQKQQYLQAKAAAQDLVDHFYEQQTALGDPEPGDDLFMAELPRPMDRWYPYDAGPGDKGFKVLWSYVVPVAIGGKEFNWRVMVEKPGGEMDYKYFEVLKQRPRSQWGKPPSVKARREERTWWTGAKPDTSGMHAYTVLIRGPTDPDRSPRPKGGRKDRFPHQTLKKMDFEDILNQLLQLLEDGKPRTLHHIGVELWDLEGSILGGTRVEDALWHLVECSLVEFTPQAPVYFRRTR